MVVEIDEIRFLTLQFWPGDRQQIDLPFNAMHNHTVGRVAIPHFFCWVVAYFTVPTTLSQKSGLCSDQKKRQSTTRAFFVRISCLKFSTAYWWRLRVSIEPSSTVRLRGRQKLLLAAFESFSMHNHCWRHRGSAISPLRRNYYEALVVVRRSCSFTYPSIFLNKRDVSSPETLLVKTTMTGYLDPHS
jgi:hypothetical protein